MQNAQIWKSIEALCDEAESVIKNGGPAIAVIQSIAPPTPAHRKTSQTNAPSYLSSKPIPPNANIVERRGPREDLVDETLSTATMTEIAAAIERASESQQKPQIMDQPSMSVGEQLRKDLMIEVSLAVRSVLANELPKMVQHAISGTLNELINTSAGPTSDNLGELEAKPKTNSKTKKITATKRTAPNKTSRKKVQSKKMKAKNTTNKAVKTDTLGRHPKTPSK